jgi:hypothetical protein
MHWTQKWDAETSRFSKMRPCSNVSFQPLSDICHDLGVVKVIVYFVIASRVDLHFLIREGDFLEKGPGSVG